MTINDILKQVQHLSSHEQRELVRRINEMIEDHKPKTDEQPSDQHWGQNLLRLLDEVGPIDLIDPEITDPVEWVNKQRQKQLDRLKPYWDGEL